MRLVLAAAVALAASPVAAKIIGMQRCILGGDEGFFRCDAPTGEDTLTIDALPYDRTVTCDDITLTGTATGGGAVTWSASPSGASGSCTGTASWSCLVDVDPDASGEGVETITVSQSGGGTDTVDVGFYVDGAHSCFLSQSVDGSYNSTLANLDPVATWQNLGTSALDVTQATAANQPTFRTSIVAGQPVVRCDGGDRVVAATAIDWTFAGNGTTATVEVLWTQGVAAGTFYSPVGTAQLTSGGRGFAIAMNDSTVNEGHRTYLWNSANVITLMTSVADVLPDGVFNLASMQIEIDATPAAPDAIQYSNGTSTASSDQTFSATTPSSALTICGNNNSGTGNFPITGDVFRVVIYNGTALTATQRGINQDVDEWALGGTLPVTP